MENTKQEVEIGVTTSKTVNDLANSLNREIGVLCRLRRVENNTDLLQQHDKNIFALWRALSDYQSTGEAIRECYYSSNRLTCSIFKEK